MANSNNTIISRNTKSLPHRSCLATVVKPYPCSPSNKRVRVGRILQSSKSKRACGSSSSSSSSSKQPQACVDFKDVEIREYKIGLGDNPSCSEGPPISLSYQDQDRHQVIPLDLYEKQRFGKRRRCNDLVLPLDVRCYLLRSNDVSAKDIMSRTLECVEIQLERKQTILELRQIDLLKQLMQQRVL